jgi:RNA polymerase sigma-70 factor (ECF subfamily)
MAGGPAACRDKTTMDASVEQAIEAVKSGDVDAYGVVLNAYQRRLRAAVAAKCPPGIDPDEIAHVAFIEAYKRIDRYQGGTKFYVWLWVFARNTLLAQIKKARRRARHREDYVNQMIIDQIEQELADETPAEDSYLLALRACVTRLSEEARALLRMRYDERIPLKKASETIGNSVSALKFQLFAIRKSLRDCVQKQVSTVES